MDMRVHFTGEYAIVPATAAAQVVAGVCVAANWLVSRVRSDFVLRRRCAFGLAVR